MPTKMPVKIRLQFDADPEEVAALDEDVRLSGAASRAEVDRRARRLFHRILVNQRAGGNLVLVGPDGKVINLEVI